MPQTALFPPLPEDQFGVHVANDMDERRLAWLASEIGEAKLRVSVAKHQAKYPGQKPFVSLLLRWHRRKVPTSVYAPIRIPVYAVYLLVMQDGTAMKLGLSGRWHQRAFDFLPLRCAIGDLLDLDRSVAAILGGDREHASSVEKAMLARFCGFQAESPWRRGVIQYGSGGHTEWLSQACLGDAVASLREHTVHAQGGHMQSLREALASNETFEAELEPRPVSLS